MFSARTVGYLQKVPVLLGRIVVTKYHTIHNGFGNEYEKDLRKFTV